MLEYLIGTEVRHQTDPHGRNCGVLVGIVYRMGHTMARVKWASGVEEILHPSELRPYKGGLLLPGESPRQARDRINGFRKD